MSSLFWVLLAGAACAALWIIAVTLVGILTALNAICDLPPAVANEKVYPPGHPSARSPWADEIEAQKRKKK